MATGGISVNPKGHGWIVVIGDSQGAMYGYELASLARELNFRLNILSAAAGNELPGEPDTLWPKVSQFLSDGRPDVIILAQARSSKLREDSEKHFGNGVATLLKKAAHLIVLTHSRTAASIIASRHTCRRAPAVS